MSGTAGQGGTEDFRTHFVGSGDGHKGHSLSIHGLHGRGLGQAGAFAQAHGFGALHRLHVSTGSSLKHPHGLGLLQTSQESESANPSRVTLDFPKRKPMNSTTSNPTKTYKNPTFILKALY